MRAWTAHSEHRKPTSVVVEKKNYTHNDLNIRKKLEIFLKKNNTERWRGVRETAGIVFYFELCSDQPDIIKRCACIQLFFLQYFIYIFIIMIFLFYIMPEWLPAMHLLAIQHQWWSIHCWFKHILAAMQKSPMKFWINSYIHIE